MKTEREKAAEKVALVAGRKANYKAPAWELLGILAKKPYNGSAWEGTATFLKTGNQRFQCKYKRRKSNGIHSIDGIWEQAMIGADEYKRVTDEALLGELSPLNNIILEGVGAYIKEWEKKQTKLPMAKSPLPTKPLMEQFMDLHPKEKHNFISQVFELAYTRKWIMLDIPETKGETKDERWGTIPPPKLVS